MSNQNTTDLKQELNESTEKMHSAEKKRTLEEQVAIDPAASYAKWDDDDKDD